MKQQNLPSFVVIVILTTITAIFWVGFSVYRVFTSKPSPDIPSNILSPLTPTLDKATIEKVQKSLFFEESQIQTPVLLSPEASPLTRPSLTPSPSPTASPSATPTGTASPSGTPAGT